MCFCSVLKTSTNANYSVLKLFSMFPVSHGSTVRIDS